MKSARFARTAVALVASVGLVVGVIAPAHAATRTTVVIVTSNAETSLNPGTPDTNLTINTDIAYLTGSGFNYYTDKKELVKNTIFGSYAKVSKASDKTLVVKYTINAGRKWSDGTPITAVDLLLSHILMSSKYSVKAGLGDPTNADVAPAFNSGNYGGTYDSHVVGLPEVSADKMSVTITYDSPIANWDLMGPGPAPVHTLVLMAEGKKTLGTAAENTAATAKFLDYFTSYNTAALKKIGKVWSEDYNITAVDSSTNPLLLVGNGGYVVTGAVSDQTLTLGVNDNYNSGPALSGIKTIVFKMIGDGTAAAQALANKEVDIYQGQPTADSVKQLKAIEGATVVGGTNACYEHLELRQGSGPGETSDYTGPFATSSNAAKNQKGKDLRTAFLLAYPRQEIVDKIVKPINPDAVVVNSEFMLPDQAGYDKLINSSGVSKYTTGTQATRTAAALALVKKYYPKAAAGSGSIKINLMLPANNSRRAAEAALVIAEEAKAGFTVSAPPISGWGGKLDQNSFDAEFYAWCPSSVTQTGTNANYQSDGGNNHIGYVSARMDKLLHSLEVQLTPAQVLAKWIQADSILIQDAVSLGIFQHPAATAYNSALFNVKPAPLSPNLVWNYWEWHY